MNKNKTIIAIILLLIDQISKYLVQVYGTTFTLIENVIRIRYVQNTGAAFSMFSGHTTILVVISLVILVLLFNLMYSYKEDKLNDLAFGLMFGGILGNMIDRIFFQYVRDFIDINLFNYPIFNIADMGIVIGVILLLISGFKEVYHEHKSK